MSSFPIKSMRQKIPAVEGRGIISSINPKLIILLVKITFVLLICGSSYLAGSLWGRHSLELHGAPLSVESLVRGGTARDAADTECKQTREKWIELRVKEGESHRFVFLFVFACTFLLIMNNHEAKSHMQCLRAFLFYAQQS